MSTPPTVWLNTLDKQGRDGRGFNLSFPGRFDFPTYSRLERKEKCSEEEDNTYRVLRKKIFEISSLCTFDHKALDPAILPTTMYSESKINPAIVLPGLFKVDNKK